MKRANEIAGLIMDGQPIADCNLDELQQMVSNFPWFVPARIVLAAKLKAQQPEETENIVDRFSLFVGNPLWLQRLLNTDEIGSAHTTRQVIEPVYSEAPVTAQKESPTTEEIVVAQVAGNNVNTQYTEDTGHNLESVVIPEQTLIEPVIGFNETSAPTAELNNSSNTFATDLEDDDNDEQVIENEPGTAEVELKIPQIKIEPIDPSKAELSFEPYHTVDYFASQGIKVKEEERPKDRFSEQLKSFTDWLKTIKRVPVTELAATAPNLEEKKVEQMAEKSLTDREVVTEAMAEVWEKQGDHEKARAIYDKLSLLDPSKSSYFAAKIDQLKHS